MGNGVTCKVMGIGIVNINIWDGVTRTLNDVRHIPALKKNLISLGTLDTNGSLIQAKDGVMRVKKVINGDFTRHKVTYQSIHVKREHGNKWSDKRHESRRLRALAEV